MARRGLCSLHAAEIAIYTLRVNETSVSQGETWGWRMKTTYNKGGLMKNAVKPLLIISLILGALNLIGFGVYYAYISAGASTALSATGLGGLSSIAQYSIDYAFSRLVPWAIVSAVALAMNIAALAKRDIALLALFAGILYFVAVFIAYGDFWMGTIFEAVLCVVAFVIQFMASKKSEE